MPTVGPAAAGPVAGRTERVSGLSVSIGGAVLPTDGASVEEVLQVADASLYAAKRAGRDRVLIAAGLPVPAARQPVP